MMWFDWRYVDFNTRIFLVNNSMPYPSRSRKIKNKRKNKRRK